MYLSLLDFFFFLDCFSVWFLSCFFVEQCLVFCYVFIRLFFSCRELCQVVWGDHLCIWLMFRKYSENKLCLNQSIVYISTYIVHIHIAHIHIVHIHQYSQLNLLNNKLGHIIWFSYFENLGGDLTAKYHVKLKIWICSYWVYLPENQSVTPKQSNLSAHSSEWHFTKAVSLRPLWLLFPNSCSVGTWWGNKSSYWLWVCLFISCLNE